MPHTPTDIVAHMTRIGNLATHQDKKEALFDTLHDMIVASVAESKTLGATDAELVPFTETVTMFETMRDQIIATDLS